MYTLRSYLRAVNNKGRTPDLGLLALECNRRDLTRTKNAIRALIDKRRGK
jgi:hypothetical protein